MNNVGSCIVSWDLSNGKDKSILLVEDMVKLVDAFQGREAEDLYKKLMVRSVK